MVVVFQDVSLTSLMSWQSQMAHRRAQMVVTDNFPGMLEIRLKEQNTVSGTALVQREVIKNRNSLSPAWWLHLGG